MITSRTCWQGGAFDQPRSDAPSTPLAVTAPMRHMRGSLPQTVSAKAGQSPAQIPAYRIHRTKGLGYVRLNGRMIYLGRANSGDSLERYRRLIGEWLVSGRVPNSKHSTPVETVTVDAMAGAYLKWCQGYYVDASGKPSAGLGPVQSAANILTELYGSTVASEFGPFALKAVRQAMIERGLCRNVVNQRIGCVKRIFRWAVGEELVPGSLIQALAAVGPLRRGRSLARETEAVRPVPDEHVEAVLPFLPPTLQAMVRLQRLTGMRSGELCILRTCDVDRSHEVWVYRPASHKTAYRDQERLVRIGPKGRAILQPFLRPQMAEAFVFSPTRARHERAVMRRQPDTSDTDRAIHLDGSGYAVTKSDRYQPRSYRRALCYAMRQLERTAGAKVAQHWHPHQLRHRHATQIRQVKGLEAARVLLGHRTLSQTLEYAEADAALASSLALELG